MAKTPEQIRQSYYDNIEARFGATIPEWLSRIRATDLSKHSEVVHWLKSEHGIGHGHATLLAHDALKADRTADECWSCPLGASSGQPGRRLY